MFDENGYNSIDKTGIRKNIFFSNYHSQPCISDSFLNKVITIIIKYIIFDVSEWNLFQRNV